ncbi:proline iminopeptidase [Heyndrickxia shackletonii]|uniref:Proline iminopeptidase n=1 Tax=Heyndrickxia shackletonii TaxID=157838 RepID=A0A0Q3TG37_9BACI|nr:alpha/beta fold hydrolase [Heyndrickxia shackletonii]KQL52609.1 proline iminopeptidase [Heyndrickxia shackletonii]NEZ00192.1 alpha/beta hydrolase [Heyndrickxia shackletonii]
MYRGKAFPINKENSISELFGLPLNGVNQWVYIRGEDSTKPVLLMVHGGPGASQIGYIRHFQKELERHFVVVNWDQRGSGMSYSQIIPKGEMTVQKFVDDIIELTEYVRQRFKKNKIYIAAHSWGSIIGLLAVHKRPDLFYQYFGIAQIANYLENEKASYQVLLEKAKKENHKKAIKDLIKIGQPPWTQLKKQRVLNKYLDILGGGMSRDGKLLKSMIKHVIQGTEYKFHDYHRFLAGQVFSKKALRNELKTVDLKSMIKTVKIPIYFLMGKYDLTVVPEPTRELFQSIKADEKQWIWFENSAHSPLFEEKEKFSEIIYRESQKNPNN